MDASLAEASVTRRCYSVADDADRDGYARTGAAGSNQTSPSGNDLACPSGFVRFAGDCNDNNNQVHPRRPEVRGNALDDNCSLYEGGPRDEPPAAHEAADEPEFLGNPSVTSTSFTPRIRVGIIGAGYIVNAMVE